MSQGGKKYGFWDKEGPRISFYVWPGANEGPATPPEKLNSDLGAKMGRAAGPKGSAQRNAQCQWG